MIFHIAICSPDGALRSRLEHQCMEFFARREDACIVEQLQSPEALLQQDAAGLRYELYLIELAAVARPEGLTAAAELRRRGVRAPLAFLAVSTVLNIGLDLIFVPVLHWGVAGVAIATAIAYFTSNLNALFLAALVPYSIGFISEFINHLILNF